MPSLEAIAAFVLRNGYALNIEIKPTPGQEQHTGRVVAAACARLWQGRTAPLLFSSFKPDALQGAREAAAHIPRALLVDTLWDGCFDAALSLGCVAVVSNYKVMTAEVLARLHGAGLRGLCYTVNDAAEARRLRSIGIDGLITDAVDRFSPHASEVCD